jgi:hypothetical protein
MNDESVLQAIEKYEAALATLRGPENATELVVRAKTIFSIITEAGLSPGEKQARVACLLAALCDLTLLPAGGN